MKATIKRIDHLGIVAGVIKDLEMVSLIDEILGVDDQEEITSGEAVAGMVLNGLGFTGRPLMLTPQFFENKALSVLFREKVEPEHFNRHKLGRTLDAISEYGCEKLFSSLALKTCGQEQVDMRYAHEDTTSYSVSGAYDDDSDTYPITVTYGHSKDLRPDQKQLVQELIVSQDGGIPFIAKTLSGNASDTIIFRDRAKKLINEFVKSGPRCLVADAKLYTKETAQTLDRINFITRVPSSLKEEEKHVEQALLEDSWITSSDDEYKTQEFETDLYSIHGQRFIVVYSEHAYKRSKKTLKRRVSKEYEEISKALFHLQIQRFMCESDARKALKVVEKKARLHSLDNIQITSIRGNGKPGRPKNNDERISKIQIHAQAVLNQALFDKELRTSSCFVLATNIPKQELSAEAVLRVYKAQDKVEKGFAFLKSPEFFASSFYLKSPSRIDALITIMTLAPLIYSLAQHHLRQALIERNQTLPNQINQQTKTPTMRWIFQLFEGIDYLTINMHGTITNTIEGLTDLRITILKLLGPGVAQIYQIS